MATQKLEVIRGDDHVLKCTFKDENGVAIDITGYKIYFTVKRRLTDSDANALIAVDATVHTLPDEGKTDLTISASDNNIPEGTYYFDFHWKDPSDKVLHTERGIYNVIESVGKRTT